MSKNDDATETARLATWRMAAAVCWASMAATIIILAALIAWPSGEVCQALEFAASLTIVTMVVAIVGHIWETIKNEQ